MNGRGGAFFLFPATATNVTLVSHPHVFAAISPTVRMSKVIRETSTCCLECEFIDTVWYCGCCGRFDRPPVLKAKVKSRQKGIVDVATLKLEARLSQLVEIICLPIKHPDHSGYREQAMALAQKLGCSKNLNDAIELQENLESLYKDYDGGGRYQHLVDQVSKQLGELRLGENY